MRHIRTTAFIDKDFPAPRHNLLMMQFGQIITHDTALLLSKSKLGKYLKKYYSILNFCVTKINIGLSILNLKT